MANLAAVLYGTHDIRLEERAVPQPGPREVLIEVRSVGVCGSDVHYYEHGRIADFVVEHPLVLGHEASGIVVATGPDVAEGRVGQRVALEPGVPCAACRECREGRYNLCRDVRFFATPPIDGTFTQYVTLAEDFAHPIPDTVSDDAGAMIEPLSVGIWACRKGQVSLGANVLIAGAGPIGVLTMCAALAAGAGEVAVADVNPERLERARELGAHTLVNTADTTLVEAASGADVFIDCTGVNSVVTDGIQAVRPAGRAVLVGMCAAPQAPLPVGAIQAREIWVTGTFRYAHTYPHAIALAASGRVPLDALVDAHFSLNDAEDALLSSCRDPRLLKSVVRVATD